MSPVRGWLALAATLILCAILSLAWYSGRRAGPAPLTIDRVVGVVTRVRDDVPSAARDGLVLQAGDDVLTGPASEALLSRGGHAPIRLSASSSLHVVRIDEAIVEVELARGSLHARVRPDEGALRVTSGRRSVLATDAAFDVSAREDGRFAVAALEGSVSVSGVVGVGTIEDGQTVVAMPDGQGVRGTVSAAPLLEVAWPSAPVATDVSQVVGHTQAGADVLVRFGATTIEVRADAQGAFVFSVPSAEHETEVFVEVTDMFGHTTQGRGRLQRVAAPPDKGSPKFQLDLDYGRP